MLYLWLLGVAGIFCEEVSLYGKKEKVKKIKEIKGQKNNMICDYMLTSIFTL